LALLASSLVGCGAMESKPSGVVGSVKGFAGIVVADEPQAAVAARDVLTAGGTAADAAVALYFTLAVTLPSTAGLGGGGVCLVHDADAQQTLALDFLPRATPDGKAGLPGNVRGMAALQNRYGKLEWKNLLAAPVDLALNGAPVSRALAREVATAGSKIAADPSLHDVFTRPNGRLVDEGDKLQQPELAATLTLIRDQGAGTFYTGPLMLRLSQAAGSIGLPLPGEAMRAIVPTFNDALQVAVGDRILHVTPPPADGGVLEAQLLALLTGSRNYAATAEAERPHLFAEAAKRVFLDRGRWLQAGESPAEQLSAERIAALMSDYRPDAASGPASGATVSPDENPWATGFVVADHNGLVVACEMTLNDLFGTGRTAPGTGVVLAASPAATGPRDFTLGPLIVTDPSNAETFFAAGASGGPTAVTAKAAVLLGLLAGGGGLDAAIAAHRIHHNGAPDVVFYEEGESDAVLSSLTQRGHHVEPAGVLGRVDSLWCPEGLPREPDRCQQQSDPRGDGLAILQTE
jgi:gamma-glutamyltranspeptidase/glutathione hydrolase